MRISDWSSDVCSSDLRWLTANGLNYQALLIFCFVFGMGGAFISLALSKTIAKWSTGAKVLKEPRSSSEMWLLQTRSEEHTSELQSLMRISYAVCCLKQTKKDSHP